MNEAQTRLNKIDPKLREVGWSIVPTSLILVEQSAFIAPGRISRTRKPNPKKADYILEYKGRKLAVIEAKSDELDVAVGVDQAKQYADALNIRYTYACNGDDIWFIDMGVKDSRGNYVIGSTEHEIDAFPSPQELWQMTFPDENPWRDKFNAIAFNRGGGKSLRYYQEIAVNNVLNAVANKKDRILLTMATGTGKTYTAFQICWKLTKAKWNTKQVRDERLEVREREPKILFISDRNILADQAVNGFEQFPEDAMCRVTPKELKKNGYKVPTARNIYFTIFQTMMTSPKAQQEEERTSLPALPSRESAADAIKEVPYFMQYPRDFFDFIIIDECHRGGANDESEWRRLMDWFDSAYQLGMTATPRRVVNANTYNYFGEPVYTYSLKQGIEDGYLVPFRVEDATSNIDDYKFMAGDKVKNGDIDKERTYTENDFYRGNIKIKDRDEHRVIELLQKINPDDKTIIFCCKQEHAMIVRNLINKHKRRPDSNYCERVTADDGDAGEAQLRAFQDNEKLRPTILTTSYKLSTGVDACNVRNIVLMRPVNNMVEFKQIIGRGTRLFDGKYFFTIYDFVGATSMFEDEGWDGDPLCSVCGNWPCTCNKHEKKPYEVPDDEDVPKWGREDEPEPCPVCGNLPCTCDGGQRNVIEVELSESRKLKLHTTWKQKFFVGDKFVDLNEFVKMLFGKIPTFFNDAFDLRKKWADPDTRIELLKTLEEAGFPVDRLEMLKNMLQMEKCDLLDVLEYIAYNSTPMEREARVRIVQEQYIKKLSKQQQQFDNLILQTYAMHGCKELAPDKLKIFINMKYNSTSDAKMALGMSIGEIKSHYYDLQQQLYGVNVTPEMHFHLHGGNYIENQTINHE